MTDRIAWELANLEMNPKRTATVLVPADIHFRRPGIIQYHWPVDPITKPIGPHLLDNFLALSTNQMDPIDFCQRYGPLGLCHQHGLPEHYENGRLCSPHGRESDGQWWEPVEPWIRLSNQVQAALNVAARIHSNRKASEAEWKPLQNYGAGYPKPIAHTLSVNGQGRVLMSILNEWLRRGCVELQTGWTKGRPTIMLGSRSFYRLFAELAIQVWLAIARSGGLAVCVGCGLPYVPSRTPASNRNNYCGACGKRAAVRDASRRYRQRKRKGGEHGKKK